MSTLPLAFPMPLSEKYRPKTISAFIGLEKQRKILSAFAQRPCSCAWLLHGDSGLGKTSLALALAEEMHAELHLIPSQKCNVDAINEVRRITRTCAKRCKFWKWNYSRPSRRKEDNHGRYGKR